ncbi:hypothetical protein SteCoe_13720 [Stentor coeruleus]|uniref:SBF1/SBF2 domain-containing protein n=1 Tax=Stentor coeruleus TaxID=5963 RepID=A0A1R2C800_9CILI|nr:hypothetical protein SteCoe_13720 [Stentor coeruleus]
MIRINARLEEIHNKSSAKRARAETFLLVLREWSLQEEFYAQGMNRIFKRLVDKPENIEFMSNFHNLIGNIAERTYAFVKVLKDEIFANFDSLINHQCSTMKKVFCDGTKAADFVEEIYTDTIESANKYYESVQECDKISEKLDKEKSSSKKEKVLKVLLEKQKSLKQSFDYYQERLNKYTRTCKKYQGNMKKIIDAYNFHENKLKESFMKTFEKIKEGFVYRYSSLFENELNFFELNFNEEPYSIEEFNLPEITLDSYTGKHPLYASDPQCWYGMFQNATLEGLDQVYKSVYIDDLNKIIAKAWLGEDLSPDDYIIYNSRIKELVGRQALCFCLNLRRNAGIFTITEKAYLKLSELIVSVLNECERSLDVENSKNIIILSQTFHVKIDHGKKFLLVGIKDHSLWKNINYWEKVINSTIDMELKKQLIENYESNKEVEAMNHKSLIFCQLISFGIIMIEVNVDIKNVCEMVKKYASRYKFTDGEMLSLIETISESLKKSQASENTSTPC